MNKHSNIYCDGETLYLLSFPFFPQFYSSKFEQKLYLFKFLFKFGQTQNHAILTKKLIGFLEEEEKCKKN